MYIRIPGKSIPFAYQSPSTNSFNKIIWKINLSSFANLLAVDKPILISIGETKIGKSLLLN